MDKIGHRERRGENAADAPLRVEDEHGGGMVDHVVATSVWRTSHDRDAYYTGQFIDGRFITRVAFKSRVEVAGVLGNDFRRIALRVDGDERDDGLWRAGCARQFTGHMVEGGHGTWTYGRAVREAEEHQAPLALQQRGGGSLATANGGQFDVRQGPRFLVEGGRAEFGRRRRLQPAVGGNYTKAHRHRENGHGEDSRQESVRLHARIIPCRRTLLACKMRAMRQPSRPLMSAPVSPPAVQTVEQAIGWAAGVLESFELCYGHGTDNPFDEAAALVFHAGGYAHEDAATVYPSVLPPAAAATLVALLERRVNERLPSAYLTGRTWFAGLEMRCGPGVLVPRSPLAELIVERFHPLLDASRLHRIVDIGTGSGCIAIACAHYLPEAQVDAADISPAALERARENIALHGLQDRVRPVLADHYAGLEGQRYDLIISNPPYVPAAEAASLPAEYLHEPAIGLASGEDGLDSARALLAGAITHLNPGGALLVEVGDSEAAVAAAWPELPFLWLEFEHGGGGVFLITREELLAAQARKAP